MCQQFFSSSEKLKIVCTIVCTVSVLFIALHTPLERTVGPLQHTPLLCYTEIFSYELDLFVLPSVQILHVLVFFFNCFVYSFVESFSLCLSLRGVREREQNPEVGLDNCE